MLVVDLLLAAGFPLHAHCPAGVLPSSYICQIFISRSKLLSLLFASLIPAYSEILVVLVAHFAHPRTSSEQSLLSFARLIITTWVCISLEAVDPRDWLSIDLCILYNAWVHNSTLAIIILPDATKSFHRRLPMHKILGLHIEKIREGQAEKARH